MNTEHETQGGGELSKESLAVALSGLLEKVFSATLVAPAFSQIGLTIGDQIKFYRIRNLIRLNEHLEGIIQQRNLNESDLQKLSLSVGFPLLEKASYQDDDYLQKKWANLLASTMQKDESKDERFSLSITFVEILHQFSRLDCEVLEYISENGISGRNKDDSSMQSVPLDPLHIHDQFPGSLAHMSLEKLVTLGCAYRAIRTPLSTNSGDGYGSLQQDVVVTLLGLNLYMQHLERSPSGMIWRSKVMGLMKTRNHLRIGDERSPPLSSERADSVKLRFPRECHGS